MASRDPLCKGAGISEVPSGPDQAPGGGRFCNITDIFVHLCRAGVRKRGKGSSRGYTENKISVSKNCISQKKGKNKTKPKKPNFNTCSPLHAREGTQFWMVPTQREEGEGTRGKGEGKTWSASAAGSSGWGNASMAEVRHEEHLILSMAIHFLTVLKNTYVYRTSRGREVL